MSDFNFIFVTDEARDAYNASDKARGWKANNPIVPPQVGDVISFKSGEGNPMFEIVKRHFILDGDVANIDFFLTLWKPPIDPAAG